MSVNKHAGVEGEWKRQVLGRKPATFLGAQIHCYNDEQARYNTSYSESRRKSADTSHLSRFACENMDAQTIPQHTHIQTRARTHREREREMFGLQ